MSRTSGDLPAVELSGDGGWRLTEHGISGTLAENGIPVIGLNSLKYFWDRRTPEEAAAALQRIITHYLTAWKKEQVILIGYSLGADVLPFMTTRLPEEIRAKIRLFVLIEPSRSVDFQFHLTDWISSGKHKSDLLTKPEVEKLYGLKIFCFYGSDDDDVLCADLDTTMVKSFLMTGGHRIRGRYGPIPDAILKEAKP